MTVPECSIEGCSLPRLARGWCAKHYTSWLRLGDPLAAKPKRGKGQAQADVALGASLSEPGPCVYPRGKPLPYRPTIQFDGKQLPMSRAVWIHAHGHPGDLLVLHTCGQGVQGCIRLAHLYLGTHIDNVRDAEADGTQYRGEGHHLAKLTEDDVLHIRLSDEKGTVLAKRYGVSKGAIYAIRKRETWKWVD